MFDSSKLYFLTLFSKREPYINVQKKEIEGILGYTPKSFAIYVDALTQQHYNTNVDQNNERLEFLGDAVIGMVVADYLFRKYPYKGENFLTEMRSKIVKRDSLNIIGERLGIDKMLSSVVYDQSRIESKDVLGDALEAFIGAIYLDKGIEFVKTWIEEQLLHEFIDLQTLEKTDANARNRLHSWVSQHKKEIIFQVDKVESLNGVKKFTVLASIDENIIASGTGFSKKEATFNASEEALKKLNI